MNSFQMTPNLLTFEYPPNVLLMTSNPMSRVILCTSQISAAGRLSTKPAITATSEWSLCWLIAVCTWTAGLKVKVTESRRSSTPAATVCWVTTTSIATSSIVIIISLIYLTCRHSSYNYISLLRYILSQFKLFFIKRHT